MRRGKFERGRKHRPRPAGESNVLWGRTTDKGFIQFEWIRDKRAAETPQRFLSLFSNENRDHVLPSGRMFQFSRKFSTEGSKLGKNCTHFMIPISANGTLIKLYLSRTYFTSIYFFENSELLNSRIIERVESINSKFVVATIKTIILAKLIKLY